MTLLATDQQVVRLAALQRLHEQERADLRDTLAVLTADRQATAWMMVIGARAAPDAGSGGRPGFRGGAPPRHDGGTDDQGALDPPT